MLLLFTVLYLLKRQGDTDRQMDRQTDLTSTGSHPPETENWELRHRWQGSSYLSYHPVPLREHISRELGSAAKPALKPRHFDMGCKCHKWHLNHHTKAPLHNLSFDCSYRILSITIKSTMAVWQFLGFFWIRIKLMATEIDKIVSSQILI